MTFRKLIDTEETVPETFRECAVFITMSETSGLKCND
jgi:hypothetical protein